jgi:hypothetical protein
MAATAPEGAVGRAAFLGGLLAFVSLVALSVIGVGHSRSLAGGANAQYWIVVGLTAAGLAAVTAGLARADARTRLGDAARRGGVAAAVLWLGVFLWEAVATGVGVAGPFELVWSVLKG